jgi:hypothetical protein
MGMRLFGRTGSGGQAIPGEKAIHQGNQMLSDCQRGKLAALTGADK